MTLPMDKQLHNINLLKKQGDSPLDTILHFAVTGGRFIVLLTEMIALMAFLYRFTLDRQIIDLNDEIKANQAIVAQYEPLELDYRNLQDRIQTIKTLDQEAPIMPNLFTQIMSKGEGIVTFTSLLISSDSIRVEADTSSVASLNTFVMALRSDPLIKEVSIDRIDNRTSNALITVAISAELKGKDTEVNTKDKKEISQ